jgi:multicomponent Na+:H+ antiporter subunit D
MTETLVVAPILVALGSVLAALVLRRFPALQRTASVLGGVAYAGVVAVAVWRVVLGPGAPGIAAYQVGNWPAPFGITLVLDGLSAFMLVVAAAVTVPAVALSARFIDRENQRVFYHPLFHLLVLGVTGAFLTGDLFNLFVWFEVMLMASYVFVSFYGNAQHTAAAFRYLTLNVVGSATFLLAVGGLYAVTGTLNMADMSRRLADASAYGVDPAPVVGLSALLFATFALKAGLVPFQFWVPGAYRAAPLPVAAMLAGATKKVGIYAIIRLYFTVFAGATIPFGGPFADGASPLVFLAPALATMAVLSILVGGLGAVASPSLEELFAYSSIGQVGFIAVPVAVAAAAGSETVRRLGLVAALVYALHHALAKGLLFLSAATVRGATGTNRIAELGGLGRQAPLLSGAVFVGALSLTGIPPLSGFFGKFLVFDAVTTHLAVSPTVATGAVLAALLAGATLTIIYVTRAWIGGFWGVRSERVRTASVDPAQVAVLVAVAGVIVLVGLGFEPVAQFAGAGAEAAMDRGAYVEAVAPAGGGAA